MPLISQQDIVTVRSEADADVTTEQLIERLKDLLESYPPVKIVSLTESVSASGIKLRSFRTLTAVVETI